MMEFSEFSRRKMIKTLIAGVGVVSGDILIGRRPSSPSEKVPIASLTPGSGYSESSDLPPLSVDANGVITVLGDGVYSVLQLHRKLQDMMHDFDAEGDNALDFTSPNPSLRVTDHIVELQPGYTLNPDSAMRLENGSLKEADGTIWFSNDEIYAKGDQIYIERTRLEKE